MSIEIATHRSLILWVHDQGKTKPTTFGVVEATDGFLLGLVYLCRNSSCACCDIIYRLSHKPGSESQHPYSGYLPVTVADAIAIRFLGCQALFEGSFSNTTASNDRADMAHVREHAVANSHQAKSKFAMKCRYVAQAKIAPPHLTRNHPNSLLLINESFEPNDGNEKHLLS